MDTNSDSILREAAGLDPTVGSALSAGDALLNLPTFRFDFISKNWPCLSGPIEIRYPTLADLIRIESIAGSGGYAAETFATFAVLITQAPGAWYRKDPNRDVPALDIGRIPDSSALSSMYKAYNAWREDFRTDGLGSDLGEARAEA